MKRTLDPILAFVLTSAFAACGQPRPPAVQVPETARENAPEVSETDAGPVERTPATPVERKTVESAAEDARMVALADKWGRTALPVGAAPTDEAPTGPVFQAVGQDVFVDGDKVDGPAALGARIPAGTGAVMLWLEGERTLRDLQPYLAAVPAGTRLYLATRDPDRDERIALFRARPLEEPRCLVWLNITSASVAELARVLSKVEDRSRPWHKDDNRVCGSSMGARLDVLQSGHGSLFWRTDRGDGPACHGLAFARKGKLVRSADETGYPELVFDYGLENDQLRLKGPVPAQPTRTPVVQCDRTYQVGTEDESSIAIARPFQRGLHQDVWRGRLYYSENACLAGPPTPLGKPDCIGSILASTSSRPDAVVDRLAAIARKKGKVYRRVQDKCVPFSFKESRSKGQHARFIRSVGYSGHTLRLSTTELGTNVGYFNTSEDIMPVVHTSGDHLFVNGQRWYLSMAACKRG